MTFGERFHRWNLWYDELPQEWRFQFVLWPLIALGAINILLTVSSRFPFGLLLLLGIIFVVAVRVLINDVDQSAALQSAKKVADILSVTASEIFPPARTFSLPLSSALVIVLAAVFTWNRSAYASRMPSVSTPADCAGSR